MAHLMISAAHKSSGKTSVSVGIAAALSRRGLTVQPAKHRVDHYIGLRAPQGWPDGLLQKLATERIYTTLRVETLRISPHLFTTQDDVTRLFQVLDRLR